MEKNQGCYKTGERRKETRRVRERRGSVEVVK